MEEDYRVVGLVMGGLIGLVSAIILVAAVSDVEKFSFLEGLGYFFFVMLVGVLFGFIGRAIGYIFDGISAIENIDDHVNTIRLEEKCGKKNKR